MLDDCSELINKRLGNYTIRRLIHETHMSAVYYGTEAFTDRPVAVKVLFPNIRRGSREYKKYLLRFQREAYLIANLRHAYIVPILAYAEYEELAYLVMPYYTNGTLGTLLQQRGQLSLYETVRAIEQIAPALDYAHSQNITHRDIKPGNFLLDDDHCLILTDFGIARLAGNPSWATLTTTNKVLGTSQYMAPEVLRGIKADLRADIYALGIVIYEMLHGDVPFTGNDFYEIMEKHINDPLPSLHGLHPDIPFAVDGVLQKATAKMREARFTSVHELATALSHAATVYGVDNAAPTVADFPPLLPEQPFLPQAQPIPPTIQAGQVVIPPVPVDDKQTRSPLIVVAWILSIVAVIMLLITLGLAYGPALLASLQSPPASTPTPNAIGTPTQAGRAAVQEYYDDWNNGQYQPAYSILTPAYQKDHPYQLSNYTNVHYSCISIGQVTEISANEVRVDITINQIEDKQSGKGTAINVYKGYFIAQHIGDKWYITPGNLPLISTHGSCMMP